MSWDSIIGQLRVKQILRSSIESRRLPHAYLFTGPDGVGKDAVAVELAKVLNCERRESVACDTCASCQRFVTLQHPNLNLIFALPVGKGEKYGDPPLAKLSNEEMAEIQEQLKLKSKNLYHDILFFKIPTLIRPPKSTNRENDMFFFVIFCLFRRKRWVDNVTLYAKIPVNISFGKQRITNNTRNTGHF